MTFVNFAFGACCDDGVWLGSHRRDLLSAVAQLSGVVGYAVGAKGDSNDANERIVRFVCERRGTFETHCDFYVCLLAAPAVKGFIQSALAKLSDPKSCNARQKT